MSSSLSPQEAALLPQIQQWLTENHEALLNDLAQWIAIPSISLADQAEPGAPFGKECAEILQHVLAQAELAGFKTEQHEGYAGSVIYGDHSKDIGLINHLDVVPAGDNWTYPPFSLSQQGDFIIGRGVADNKGPGVMNFYMLKLIRHLGIPLHHNLRIIYGLAEETTMADMAWYAKHGPVPDYSIVTDGLFPVNNAQKGQLVFTLHLPDAGRLAGISAGSASNSVPDFASVPITTSAPDKVREKLAQQQSTLGRVAFKAEEAETFILEAQGNGGHAAFPDGTLNATQVLLSALLALDLLEEHEHQLANTLVQLFASPYGVTAGLGLEDEKSGKLTLNPGVWHSPEPEVLAIDCDIRYPISWRGEQIISKLQQRLETTGITLKAGWRDVAPFYLPESHPVISLLQQVWNDTTGHNDRPYAMGGVTHSKKLPNAITFGPGYRKTAENTPDFLPQGHGHPHGADEATHLPSLLEALPKYVIALIRLDKYLFTQR